MGCQLFKICNFFVISFLILSKYSLSYLILFLQFGILFLKWRPPQNCISLRPHKTWISPCLCQDSFMSNAKEINFTEQSNLLVSMQHRSASVTALMPCVQVTTVLRRRDERHGSEKYATSLLITDSISISIVKPTRYTIFRVYWISLFMFRTVFPSIIRSPRLYIQRQVYVIRVHWPLASGP